MTDTPIIDAACEAYLNGDPVYEDDRARMQDALCAALPWDLPADRLEAMARAIARWQNREYDWRMFLPDVLAAYRADPIMRELYP